LLALLKELAWERGKLSGCVVRGTRRGCEEEEFWPRGEGLGTKEEEASGC
jgi:hypothetical protein